MSPYPSLPPAQPPVGYIPTPTAAYRQHRKTAAVLLGTGAAAPSARRRTVAGAVRPGRAC
ncbi:hypothetical protein LP420_10830 [Massilia sp. B-10]|nr:hypothetical protein LP420_10830 [Massilia sp. B-10]